MSCEGHISLVISAYTSPAQSFHPAEAIGLYKTWTTMTTPLSGPLYPIATATPASPPFIVTINCFCRTETTPTTVSPGEGRHDDRKKGFEQISKMIIFLWIFTHFFMSILPLPLSLSHLSTISTSRCHFKTFRFRNGKFVSLLFHQNLNTKKKNG